LELLELELERRLERRLGQQLELERQLELELGQQLETVWEPQPEQCWGC
jgi:hypothetical protein